MCVSVVVKMTPTETKPLSKLVIIEKLPRLWKEKPKLEILILNGTATPLFNKAYFNYFLLLAATILTQTIPLLHKVKKSTRNKGGSVSLGVLGVSCHYKCYN